MNASFKPTEVNWTEIPYESINLMDEIGSGAFGVVYKGEILRGKNDVTPCAVKALKGNQTRRSEFQTFLKHSYDIKLKCCLDNLLKILKRSK